MTVKQLRKTAPAAGLTVLLLLLSAVPCSAWFGGKALAADDVDALAARADGLYQQGDWRAAATLYEKAAKHTQDRELHASLLVRLVDCHLRRNKRNDAYDVCRRLLNTRAVYIPYKEVVARVRNLAEDFATGRASVFGFRNRTKAIELYTFVLEKAPAAGEAPSDTLRLAQLQVEDGQFEDAVFTYRDLLRKYPESAAAADGRFALIEVLIHLSRSGDGDGRLNREAESELRLFQQLHPGHAQAAAADELMRLVIECRARAMLDLGIFYLRPAHARIPAVCRYLHDVVRYYPATESAAVAAELLRDLEAGTDVRLSSVRLPDPDAGVRGGAAAAVTPPSAIRREEEESVPVSTPPVSDDVGKWLQPISDYRVDGEGGGDE